MGGDGRTLPGLDLSALRAAEVTSNVVDVVVAVGVAEHLLPKRTGLLKVD